MRSGIAASDPLVRDRIIKDLFSQGPTGAFLSTVFARPDPVNSYDSVANQAQMLRNDMYSAYMQPNTNDLTDKRIRHISGMLGMGSAGVKMMKAANNFAPGIMEMVLGHHGGMAAQMNIVNSANAIGAVRSGFMGGMADPQQMNANQQLGMRIAMEAYRNNFDKSGGVDIGQTRGLSLDQATLISNRTLQDKSQYGSFAKKAKSIDPSLTEQEIENFRKGTATTDKVVAAFNKHIKGFTKEINAFTASVTKMTGDFEETINFMQRATGGQLFKDTEEAGKLRKDAVRMANNLRIVAADAGMNPQELYMRSGLAGDIFEASQGRRDAFANKFANKVSGTRLGMIGAAAYADWVKHNPNATKEERDAMGDAVNRNISDYGEGDMSKMTVVLGRLVDEGKVSAEDAKKLAASGNAEQMYQFISKQVGGETNLDNIIADGRKLASWRHRYSKTIGELDEIGFSKGLARERLEKGGRNRMDDELSFLANTAGDREEDVKKELDNLTDAAFRNKETLKAAGMTEDEAAEFAQKAEQEGWDRDRVIDEANKYKNVDTLKLTRDAYKEVSNSVKDSKVLTESEKAAVEEARKGSFGREVTNEDLKKARMAVGTKVFSQKLQDFKTRWASAGTIEEKTKSLTKSVDLFNKALDAGESGYSLFATPDTAPGGANIEAVLAYGTTFDKSDSKNPQAQQRIIQAGKNAYSKVLDATGDEEVAWRAAQNEMLSRGAMSVKTDKDTRKTAMYTDMAQDAAENILLDFFKETGVSEAEQKKYSTQVQAYIKDAMKSGVTAEEAIQTALNLKVGDPKDANGNSVRPGGVYGYLDAHADTVAKYTQQAYVDKVTGITIARGRDVKLSEEQEKEAAELAQQSVIAEERGDIDSFSAGTKTEDAANASRGMGKLSESIEEAVRSLKNLSSAAQVLASDQRDAENQSKGFMDRVKLSKERRDALLDKYGLGAKTFGNELSYDSLRTEMKSLGFIEAHPELKTKEQQNEYLQNKFKKILAQDGLDLTDDEAVGKALEQELGATGADKKLKALQATLNGNKEKGDPTYRTLGQIVAGFSAGADATATEKGEQALAQKLKIEGIDGPVTDQLSQILNAIRGLNKS